MKDVWISLALCGILPAETALALNPEFLNIAIRAIRASDGQHEVVNHAFAFLANIREAHRGGFLI